MKRVLSIDGGGIRGIIPATILAEIENRTGKPLSKSFDLISGTSTGGIIAAGLSIPNEKHNPKFSADDLVSFYQNDSKNIFKKGFKYKKIFRSQYSNRDLQKALASNMGRTRFGNLLTNVMIPTYDLSDQCAYFFKSWKPATLSVPTYKIVSAGASAPTYFDPTPIILSSGIEKKYFIDGSVAANNPSMCAYVEAKRLWKDEEVFVFSIGSGSNTIPINPDHKKKWGAISWISSIAELFMDASTDTSDYQLRTIQPDLYTRFQVNLTRKSKLDDISPANISSLQEQTKQLCAQRKYDIDRIVDICS